jgi:hypothetical protein
MRFDRVVPPVSGNEGVRALSSVHARQIHRDPWPDFAAFDKEAYAEPLRRHAADLWRRRSQMEYASVAQFTRISAELADHLVPLPWHGVFARIITDEVRHAEICAQLARALHPDVVADASYTLPPWPWPKRPAGDSWEEVAVWAAHALLVSSCLGEALSVPSYEALVVVSTDRVVTETLQQIRKDEPLHATFGWELVQALIRDVPAVRPSLQANLGNYLRGFEASMGDGIPLSEIAGRSIDIAADAPNLGTLTSEQTAFLYYATLESELLPRLLELGLDGTQALLATAHFAPQ